MLDVRSITVCSLHVEPSGKRVLTLLKGGRVRWVDFWTEFELREYLKKHHLAVPAEGGN